MAWVSVHNGVNGPKLRKFAKSAGISKAEALGTLVICTVHRHNRRVMEALLAHVFGIYGVFQDRAGRGENGA